MITCEMPSDDTDRSSSMPLTVLTASSILSVISVSICSGAAPGWMVVMTTVGKSTFGNWSTPRRENEKAPMTVSDTMSTVANTGRRTQSAASHCMAGPKGNADLRSQIADWVLGSGFSVLRLGYCVATFKPSTNCATLVVATNSPAFSPFVTSTSASTV